MSPIDQPLNSFVSKRTDAYDLERRPSETNGGPGNREPWANRYRGQADPDSLIQEYADKLTDLGSEALDEVADMVDDAIDIIEDADATAGDVVEEGVIVGAEIAI